MFWIAVILACLSVLLIRAVAEPVTTGSASGTGARPAPMPRRALPNRYWRVAAALTLFALVNFPDALLLLKGHQLGLSTAAVIAAYALYNLAYAAASYPARAPSDRLPRRTVYTIGLI